MSAVPYLLNILRNNIDINALSEHWLRKSQFDLFDTIDSRRYKAYGKGFNEFFPENYRCKARSGVSFLVSNQLCPFIY